MRTVKIFILFALFSCNQNEKDLTIKPFEKPKEDTTDFFPVTSYFKGQIYDFQNKGINPLQYITVNKKTDSVWLMLEKLPEVFAPFLEPLIDSNNLKDTFKQTGFLDQTINAYTFSYDPKIPLPNGYALQRWDVYIDPDNHKVKRIYIVKNVNKETILQLTWQADAFCKMVWIRNTDSPFIEKEILVKWDF